MHIPVPMGSRQKRPRKLPRSCDFAAIVVTLPGQMKTLLHLRRLFFQLWEVLRKKLKKAAKKKAKQLCASHFRNH